MFARALIACLSLLFLISTYEKAPASPSTRPLVVITSPDSPPFEYKDTASGDDAPIGFDIDVVKAIAKKLGRPLKIVEVDFSALIPALNSGRADMAIAYLSPTEERRKSVAFSAPYYIAKAALVVKEGSTIKTEDDLAHKRLGVQLGSTHEPRAKQIKDSLPSLKIKTLNKVGELIQELKNNRIDAVLTEEIVAENVASSTKGLKVVPITLEGGEIAIAFPKGSPLVPEVNQALSEMQGEIAELAKKWLLPSRQEMKSPSLFEGFERILPSIPYILKGVQVTLAFTLVSLLLGFLWGIILSFCKVSHIKPLNWFAIFYTSIFRGTPLLLQLTLIYFAIPQLFNYNISIWEAGILAFTLNSGAYLSEHIRAGINAVDKGQMEAALSLGIPYPLTMRDIILPQAIRNILPSLVNESVDLLKESALVSVIGGADILRRATIVATENYLFFEPLIVAGALYYVLVMLLTCFVHFLERKLRPA